ncbi:MAG: sulfatase-like hydrolase/transferase [Puniceicoccaceae bacterium]|nr:sulfatase-like hydrolase/transferase [Puniceicoccaceae bacterium]
MLYSKSTYPLIATALFFATGFIFGEDPQISSWYTTASGQYARIYETLDDQNSKNAVSVWSRGQGNQSLPTYAGVHEVSYSNDWVYIRSSNLASYVMGPWYLDTAKSNIFPNYPANRAVLYRFPRSPSPAIDNTLTGLGAIGYFVDGVAMFDNRDAFSYSNSNASDARPNTSFRGDGIWNRDAYVNESVTFDAGNAHQAGSNYHYHANPPGLRFLLGDHVDYDSTRNTYSENVSAPSHSPIIGWVRDGYPIYGPYGYSDPNDASSSVRRMLSGYQKRDGSNGSTNLNLTGRTSLPAWAVTAQSIGPGLATGQEGPDVGIANYPLGHYIEDYAYKGDLGLSFGSDFDLDLYNGRFCKTPDFPNGTYAYFITIESDGTPVFPYNIGRWYYGDPSGSDIDAIHETVVKYFEGGPEKQLLTESIVPNYTAGDVTVTWDAIEGGSYEVSYSSDLAYWKISNEIIKANNNKPAFTEINMLNAQDKRFYKLNQTALEAFDSTGFDYSTLDYTSFSTVTLTLSGAGTAPADLSVDPSSISLEGNSVTYLGRPTQDQIQLRVDLDAFSDGNYQLEVTFDGFSESFDATLTVGTSPVDTGNNILLIIVDDWGYDWSPVHNASVGLTLPNMPNLQSLASTGLQFNRAYAQPICSPTRATILTGRHPFRHGVGDPNTNNILSASELTIPEIFTQEGSSYALATFGKWHLGGGSTGPYTRGGWNYFKGILQGGVPNTGSYLDWTKTEVINGVASTTSNYSIYTTTDQIDDAVAWINSNALGSPWFCWLALNAPHTPFHEPPANLAPPGGYTNPSDSSNTSLYCRMLEAMDTEIGRLLENIDLNNTNVIIIGDNGSPSQVAQLPYGNGNAKADLYEGGIHVPLIISGPDITLSDGSSTDALVHCVDLFSTILQLAGINPSTATSAVGAIDSNSLIPILSGGDSSSRVVVAEKFGDTVGSGRALLSADYPEFKLIIHGDPLSSSDNPSYEFYNISQDSNEQSPLNTSALNSIETIAYDFFIAMDASLGGGYSDPADGSGSSETVYLELIDNNTDSVPPLVRAGGNNAGNPVHPQAVTIGGQEASFDTSTLNSGSSASRVDSSGSPNQYFVKVTFNPVAAGLSSGDYSMVVTFRGANNSSRTFNATNTYTVP